MYDFCYIIKTLRTLVIDFLKLVLEFAFLYIFSLRVNIFVDYSNNNFFSAFLYACLTFVRMLY